MDCSKCGATGLAINSSFCEYCGSSLATERVEPNQPLPINKSNSSSTSEKPISEKSNSVVQKDSLSTIDSSGLSQYYIDAFREIESNGGGFTVKWNWPAFLFSGIWYFVKGMWAKGLIIWAIALSTGGVAAIFLWLYAGLLGTYDYYLLKVKKQQLWDKL